MNHPQAHSYSFKGRIHSFLKWLPILVVALLFLGTERFAQTQTEVPARTGYITDMAGVVDDNTRAQLTNLLQHLQQKSGIEFAVITVPTLGGSDMFGFSRRVATNWNVGARNTSTKSLLLVLAVAEKQPFTQFSKSVQDDLPEAVLGEMSLRIKAGLTSGDVSGGLSAGVNHFVSSVAQKLAIDTSEFAPPTQQVVAANPSSERTEQPAPTPLVRPRVTKTPAVESLATQPASPSPDESKPVTTIEASTRVRPPVTNNEEPAPTAKAPERSTKPVSVTATPKPSTPKSSTPKSSTPKSSTPKPPPTAEDDADEAEEVELTLTLPLEARITKLKEFLRELPDSKSKPRALEILVSAYASLGDQKLKAGETAAGLEQLNLAIETAPPDMSASLFSGVIAQIPLNLYLRGQRAEAATVAQALETKFGSDPKRLVALSTFYVTTEQAAEAVKIATQAVALGPDMAETHQALGLAHHISLNLHEAMSEYKRAVELDPNSKAARRGLADLSRGLGKPEDALTLYRQILEADANDKSARAGLILTMMDLGRSADAKAELELALKADPKSLPLLTGVAYWFAAHNDVAQATDYGRRALEVEPRYTWSHVAMARTFMAQRKPLNAERALRFARQYGKFPTLDYELASALVAAGLLGEAADLLLEGFDWKDGQIETRLAGRTLVRGQNFLELLAPERRGSIFQFTAADTEANAKVLKDLLVFAVLINQDQRGGTLDERAIVAAAKELASGNDAALVHRQLYAASRLLQKGIGLAAAHDLAEAARSSADAGLTVPEVTLAVQADEYRELRARAIAQGGTPTIANAPRNILSNLLRGRIEDLSGWALFNQDKVEQSVDHLKRAANILPEGTPTWRSAVWHLGAALDRLDRREEALANYIKSYNVGDPDPARRSVIEHLYRKMHGSLAGLDEQIQSAGVPSLVPEKTPDLATATPQLPPAPTSPPPNSPMTETATPSPTPVRSTPVERPSSQPPAAASSIVERMNKPAPTVVTIKGRVTDSENNPIANVVVVLISPQGTVLASTTDAKGNYSFSVAPSTNNYRVIPSKDGYKFEPVDRQLPGVTEDQRDMNFVGWVKTNP